MCGVLGICAPDRDVAHLAHFGLHALQHRGQESAGIAVSDDGRLAIALRELGLVAQVCERGERERAPGGSSRSATPATPRPARRQVGERAADRPARTPRAPSPLGHNGNLVNASELRDEGAGDGMTLSIDLGHRTDRRADRERPAAARQRRSPSAMTAARGRVLRDRARGGEAAGVPRPARLPAARPRPTPDGWVVASETCALDLVGADFEREVAPGELLIVDESGVESLQAVDRAPGALCIFEFFYLARPDSRLEGVEVHGARVRMGELLAAEAPAEADLVLPIPDSGTPAAIGFSRATGIPFSEGLIKNRYVGRTFIQPDQALREQGIRLKFNPLAEVAGKRVVVVDDSIVRGNTTRQILQMLFDAGATEVHIRVSSPPIIGPCFYGIDFADEEELIAFGRSVEDVRESIGATSLAYLSLDGLQPATARPASALCRACLTGEYPTRIPEGRRLAKLRFEPVRA